VITVVSDTHGTDGHRLTGRTLAAVRRAELVVHAGDFTTEAVLDAIEAEVGADAEAVVGAETGAGDAPAAPAFAAVHGNNATPAVRERLPATRVVAHAGVRIVVVHGHEHDATALSLLARQERADLAVVGHSHEPDFRADGPVPVLNPGSYADPRWYRPAHAELERTDSGLDGRLVSPEGDVFRDFSVTVD
jgi:putative phosphoesterase